MSGCATQFAAGCTNERIQERLLHEPGDRTLENLELIALTMERALQEAPTLAAASVTFIDRLKQTTGVNTVDVMWQLWYVWTFVAFNGLPRLRQTVRSVL